MIFVAAMIFTLLLICLFVNPLIRLSVNPLISLPAGNVGFILLTDESWAEVEVKDKMLIKKLSNAFTLKECNANEVDLSKGAGFMKQK